MPFYVYEFEARSGYAVPVPVLERLRERASNLAGLKVSDKPFEAVEPYLLDGLDVFVGAEALVRAGLERGAAGAVSGLAAVFPEHVVALVRDGSRRLGRAAERARPLPVPGRGQVRARPARRAGARGRARTAAHAVRGREAELDAWLESS